MCGINGFLNYSGVTISDHRALIRRMNTSIEHRGPDDCGIWERPDGIVTLGHQRLSIQDLSSAGRQPMHSPRGATIVFNGEIYNFKSLKRSVHTNTFATDTDTEVLLHLYDSYGRDMLKLLNGMFAFAIWDPAKREMFLARDRIGIKPLYYSFQGGVFSFSSEIKALLTLPWVRAELDEEAFYHFLTYNKVLPPGTMFKNIFKLHPGHCMVVQQNGEMQYEAYWDISRTNYDNADEETLQQRLLDKLQLSVNRRLISDVPVGAFLSGGVDSSAILALMRAQTTKPVTTYAVGFKDAPGYSELHHARRVAKQFGTHHREIIVGPEDIRNFLPSIVDIFDEPLADATAIPIHFLARCANEDGNKVILTGDGADELFCGYRSWALYAKLYPFYRAYVKLPAYLKKVVANAYGIIDTSSPNYEMLHRAVDRREFFWGGARGIKESVKASYLGATFLQRTFSMDSYGVIERCRQQFERLPTDGRENTDVDWMCFLGIKNLVPNVYLYRADRLGMANSVEIRVPFLDHELVNYALSIPGRFKVSGGEPKSILKKALEPLLPADVLYRKKKGFCVPLREWAGEIMLDYLDERANAFCSRTGLLDAKQIQQQMDSARAGSKNHTSALWNIYFLINWFERWLG